MTISAKEDIRRAVHTTIRGDSFFKGIFQVRNDFDREALPRWCFLSKVQTVANQDWVSDDHDGFFQIDVKDSDDNEYSQDKIVEHLDNLFLKKPLATDIYSTIVFGRSENDFADGQQTSLSYNFRATREEPV